MAKASAEGGATQYLAEGQEVPDDLPDGVRLVGPGAPAEDVPEPDEPAEPEAEAEAGPEPPAPASSPAFPGPDDEDGPPDYGSYPVTVLRDLARERGVSYGGLVKADLAAALAQWDTEHPEGD